MHYLIYKVTNKINGKFYIGSHKTNDLDDNYMGSGKYLKRSIEKHGVENFEKQILFVFDNPEDMYAKEAEIVNEDFLSEENTYNLKIGGFGGFDYINSNPEIFLTENRLSSLMTRAEQTERWLTKYNSDEEFRNRVKENLKLANKTSKKNNPKGTFYGKSHKESTKKLMSEKAKERLSDPRKNSQYGTMWITNGKENKKIKRGDNIPQDYIAGRKID